MFRADILADEVKGVPVVPLLTPGMDGAAQNIQICTKYININNSHSHTHKGKIYMCIFFLNMRKNKNIMAIFPLTQVSVTK